MTMYPPDELPPDYDPRKRPWYADAVAVGDSTLTEPYTDASTGQLIVTATTPVSEDGNLLGVVGGTSILVFSVIWCAVLTLGVSGTASL